MLLARVAKEAEAQGLMVVSIETPEKRSLPALLIPALRSALLKLNRVMAVGELGKRALKVLGGFVGAMKVKFQDVEFALDLGSELGVADSGDLEDDLTALFLEVGAAAKERKTAVVLLIDEIQYIDEQQFAALIMALHKCSQNQVPLTLTRRRVAAAGRTGRARQIIRRKTFRVSRNWSSVRAGC